MKDVKKFIKEMRATSSSLEKIKILKKQKCFVKGILEYTYNPYKQFYVTSKTCKKNNHLTKATYFSKNIFDLLDDLRERYMTGHSAIEGVNYFISKNKEYEEIIYDIIDKDLKIRAGAKLINKAFPGLIPEFNVALAQEYKGKCDWTDGWYASRKLDGVRCLAVVDEEGECTLYSRMGKELTTLNKVKEAIEKTGIINAVFDGEICLLDENGNEDFQGVMKQLRRKDHQIENPVFVVFDMIHKPDFDSNKGNEILSERLHTLRSWYNGSTVNMEIIRRLDQFQVTDGRHFDMWGQTASDNNWEGFMVRKDVGYEGKRSKNLLKVKTFHDAEYVVRSIDSAPMAVVRDGKEKQETMLSQVYIMHKGYSVAVGSGFTQEQRIKYHNNPGDIIGKTITVQYFEETKNQEGGISLRFPTVKIVHGEKRDM